MKTKIAALVVGPIVGAILGLVLAGAINNGWFSSLWQQVETPPVKIRRLVAVDADSLWVQSDTGSLYYNADTARCATDCWQPVTQVQLPPTADPDETVSDQACSPEPPLSDVAAKISQCRIILSNWNLHRGYTYALRQDGSLYLWQTSRFEAEAGDLFIDFLSVCGGGFAFLFAVLFFLPLWEYLAQLSKRARNAKEHDGSVD